MTVGLGKRRLGLALAGLLALGVPAEIVLRAAGIDDLPLYKDDPELGYLPLPGSGRFLNRYAWEFNELGMGVRAAFAPMPEDVVLVGDSIVQGGFFLDQAERLGPQLSHALGRRVWPVGAASWALLNELRYLALTREVASVRDIVIVTNSEDFTALSRWNGEHRHPTRRPASILLYSLGMAVDKVAIAALPAPAPPASNAWERALDDLLRSYPGRTTIVLHPMRAELPTGPDATALRQRADGARFCEIAPALERQDYKDYIHPSRDGTQKLAIAIARCLAL